MSIIFGAHSFPPERISSLKKFLGTSFGSRQEPCGGQSTHLTSLDTRDIGWQTVELFDGWKKYKGVAAQE